MRELQQQLTNALLMIVTVAAVVAAAINFQLTAGTDFHAPAELTRPRSRKLIDWGFASDVGGVICQMWTMGFRRTN